MDGYGEFFGQFVPIAAAAGLVVGAFSRGRALLAVAVTLLASTIGSFGYFLRLSGPDAMVALQIALMTTLFAALPIAAAVLLGVGGVALTKRIS